VTCVWFVEVESVVLLGTKEVKFHIWLWDLSVYSFMWNCLSKYWPFMFCLTLSFSCWDDCNVCRFWLWIKVNQYLKSLNLWRIWIGSRTRGIWCSNVHTSLFSTLKRNGVVLKWFLNHGWDFLVLSRVKECFDWYPFAGNAQWTQRSSLVIEFLLLWFHLKRVLGCLFKLLEQFY